MARLFFALVALTLASGCGGGSAPPAELGGLWSAGPAACAAGVGVRLESDAIVAAYQDQSETLFARPRYAVLEHDDLSRVRIESALPRRPGGPRVGGRGVLVLAQAPDGRIAADSHTLLDGRTGAARLQLEDDPAFTLLALQPCGGPRGRGGLRGLTAR
jgi:hypothetical protein